MPTRVLRSPASPCESKSPQPAALASGMVSRTGTLVLPHRGSGDVAIRRGKIVKASKAWVPTHVHSAVRVAVAVGCQVKAGGASACSRYGTRYAGHRIGRTAN